MGEAVTHVGLPAFFGGGAAAAHVGGDAQAVVAHLAAGAVHPRGALIGGADATAAHAPAGAFIIHDARLGVIGIAARGAVCRFFLRGGATRGHHAQQQTTTQQVPAPELHGCTRDWGGARNNGSRLRARPMTGGKCIVSKNPPAVVSHRSLDRLGFPRRTWASGAPGRGREDPAGGVAGATTGRSFAAFCVSRGGRMPGPCRDLTQVPGCLWCAA